MDWNNDTVLKFLELYKMHPVIWDPKACMHRNRNSIAKAWEDIKDSLGHTGTIHDLKRKKESLMSAYRSYKIKIKKSKRLSNGCKSYKPSWFAFQLMDSFIGTVYECNADSESETCQEETDDTKISLDSFDDTGPGEYTSQETSYHGHTQLSKNPTPKPMKRRSVELPETQPIKKPTDQSYGTLRNSSEQDTNKDEECELFGKFLAKKLSRLPDECRDLIMVKIHQLVFETSLNYDNLNSHAAFSPTDD